MVICVSYTATNYLFILSAGVHFTKFNPIFASFQQKCLEKIFVALGVHLHPLHPRWLRLCPQLIRELIRQLLCVGNSISEIWDIVWYQFVNLS